MGTAGGSGADPGRGTHSRSELTTPHLSHLAQALNVQQLLKKKFGILWQILALRTGRGCRPAPERPPDDAAADHKRGRRMLALIAQ